MMKNAQTAANYASTSVGAGARDGLLAKAKDAVASALRKMKSEGEIRQAMWELDQLDDHALRDIGLNRCDIEAHLRNFHR